MKKTSKLLSIILSLLMLFSITAGLDFSAYALSSSGSCGTNVTYTYTYSNGIGVLTISGTGAMKDYSSSSSNQSPFYNQTNINYVIIKDGVTSIGNYAFYGCTGIKELKMPASIKIYDSQYTFYNCSNIQKVTLTKGTGTMQDYASSYRNTPWYISRNSLKELVIEDGVKNIGSDAFEDCTGLTSLTIGDSVTSIGYYAFYGCTGLTSVTIPNSVTSIGYEAFYNCTGLTSVTIGNGVTSIDDYAFYNCEGLTKVNINSIEAWCKISFSDYYSNPLRYAHNLYLNDELVTDLVIPDSVTSIGNYAFQYCTGLTSVTIPDSVTSIGSSAFSGCTGLTKVNINSIEAWCKISFSDYYSNPLRYAHNLYLNDELVTDLVIPDSVTSIGNYAFCECTGLTSVTIPDSVTSIGSDAFEDCTGLTSATIPDSITSIGYGVFSGCTGLTSVTIPDSVTSIDDYAFSGCTGLTSVTIPDSVTSIGNSVFRVCTGLTSVTIPDSVTSIGESAFSGCTGLTSVTIPDCVTSIGKYAFGDCTGLTSVTIPDSVTSIGYGVFSGCTGLTSVTIPDSVTSIGDSVFYGCTDLKTIYLFNKDIEIQNFVSTLPKGSTLYAYDSTDASIYCSIYGINYKSLDTLQCDENGHFYSLIETVAPTCTKAGKKIYECSVCKKSYDETIKATGHTPNAPVQENINQTSCNKAGTCDSVVYCKVCKAEISRKQETIEATSHNYEAKTVAPNCMYQGYTEHKCSICGDTYIDSFVQATDVHIYKSAITTQPTCTTKGIKTFTCSVCGDSYKEDIAMIEHTIVTDKAVAPTCKTSGLTEGSHCSVCGTVLVAQMTVNATHHSPATAVEENRTEATCQKAGSYDSVIYCSVCNEELSRTTTVIPVVEHSYAQTVIAPTCEFKGYTLNKCVYCGESYKDNFVDTTDIHSYKTVVTVQPTCTEKGVENHTCTICGDTYNTDIEMIEHTAVTDNAVAPTCTTTGLTEGSHCSVCGTVLVAQTAVTATGHTQKATTTKATTSKNGKITYTCSVCGATTKSATTIYYPKTITLSTTSYTYDGKEKKPTVKVVDANGKTVAATNYTVTYASGRKNVGKYTVKIAFKGNYSGTVSKTFTIVPKTTSISSLTAVSKGFTVKWKKQATQTTGYQIQYSTSSKFTNPKTVTISKNSTTSKTISKLSGKKKYYVRVRTYKTVGKTKYYSNWSSAKSVTTKK